MTSEADDPRSASEETGPAGSEDSAGPSSEDENARDVDGEGAAGQLDLPLEAMLDWGSGPDNAESELEAQSAEALVAAERDEYLDALKRLQADFDNFRKRSLRQQTELLEHATEGLCMRLLPVLDALDLAIAHVKSQAEPSDSDKALEQIDALLRDTLAREGIEKIDAVGVAFDPTIHDAVGTLPSEPAPAGAPAPGRSDAARHAKPAKSAVPVAGDEECGQGETPRPAKTAKAAGHNGPIVVQVMRAGYKMKSKVLRPAMVFVTG
ncbi:MAG: nucleotide exchange factor GrpE [Acidimicrobiales bacterium]